MRLLIILFVFISTSVSLPVLAQTPEAIEQAREHFSLGQRAFQHERWMDCATHFEASFQAVFAPELLYNIGLCYERAADALSGADSIAPMERAVSAYTRYLRELPLASDAATVQIRVTDLRTLLERARVASVPEEVVTEPETPPVAPEPVVAPVVDPDLVAHDVVVHSIPEPVNRGFGFGWTVTGGSFTLASFVTAIGFSLAAQSQFNSLSTTCGQSGTCSQADIDNVSTMAAAANAMYVVSGILLAATGLAFGLEFHFWNTPAETHASLSYSIVF
jgi:hypothetical protein